MEGLDYGLGQSDIDKIKRESLETFEGGSNLVQSIFQKGIDNPVGIIIAIVLLGMVFNKQGGLKLGKVFELKA